MATKSESMTCKNESSTEWRPVRTCLPNYLLANLHWLTISKVTSSQSNFTKISRPYQWLAQLVLQLQSLTTICYFTISLIALISMETVFKAWQCQAVVWEEDLQLHSSSYLLIMSCGMIQRPTAHLVWSALSHKRAVNSMASRAMTRI